MNQCKFAYLWISGKRRHSRDSPRKSLPKRAFFIIILRHWDKTHDLTGKKIS